MTKPSPISSVRRIESALKKVALLLLDDPRFEIVYERLEAELQEAQDKAEGKKSPAQLRAAALLAS